MRPADSPTVRNPIDSFSVRTPAPADDGPETLALSTGSFGYSSPALLPELNYPRVRGYEILSLIGSGGMGVVYKARHRELRRVVALKMLRGAAASDPEFRERFRTEAEAVARLQHPNIIQVFEVGTIQPQSGDYEAPPFIALEFVEGASLTRFTSSPQTPEFAARMIATLARAAHAAHRVGVVHRDLKPANVLLTSSCEPKIADFGLAKRIDLERDVGGRFVTQAGVAVGTPEYMAPEQVAGEDASAAIDIHALGVMLYELLTARVPFQGPTPSDTMYLVRHEEPVPPRRLQPSLPRDLDTICLKCLAKAPGRRYETAEALADDLDRWANGLAIRARPIGAIERGVRWAQRKPTVAALSLAVICVAAIGMTGVIWKWQDAEKEKVEAQRETAHALREQYRAEITAVSSALQLHDGFTARRASQSAPERLRNWEWDYFSQRLDTSHFTLGSNGERIHWATFAPRSKSLTTVADGGILRFWDLHEKCEVEMAQPAPNMGRSSTDAAGLRCASTPLPPEDHLTIIRELRTGKLLTALHGHEKPIVCTTFSPDGKRIATGANDGEVRVWDSVTGTQQFRFQAHPAQPGDIAFSADGLHLATAGKSDRTARIWDLQTGASRHTMLHDAFVDTALFNPAGDRLLTASWYPAKKLWLWNAETGELQSELLGHCNEIRSFEFSRDGKRLATGSMDQTVRIWDGSTGKFIAALVGHKGWVYHTAFSPDGKRIVSASQDKTLRMWDVATGVLLAVMHGHTAEVLKVAYSEDGKTIVSVSRDGTIKYWNARKVELGNVLRGHTDFVYGVAFHPDGERVASASWDGTVRIWNATTRKQLSAMSYGANTIVASVAFHPNGNLLASLGRDEAVRLWDVETGREVHRWNLPSFNWQDSRLAFSPDGRFLAAGSYDRKIRIWDVKSKAEYAVLSGHTATIRDLTFSHDSKWLASVSELPDRTVRIWDVEKREPVAALEGHTETVYAVAFDPKSRVLASGSNDGTVRLWDTSSWTKLDVLKHGTNVYSLAFSRDGSRLASACADNKIRLWDVANREGASEVAELQGHTDYVHSIAFSRDGTRLVSGSGDNTLRIWDTISTQERNK